MNTPIDTDARFEEASTEPQVPHAPDAEAAVIGLILLDPKYCLPRCDSSGVNEDWFYETGHRLVWNAVTRMRRVRMQIDTVMVSEFMAVSGQAEKVGGVNGLMQMTERVFSPAQIMGFLEVLKDRMVKRQALRLSAEMASKARNGVSGAELAAWASESSKGLSRTVEESAAQAEGMDDLAVQALGRMEERVQGRLAGIQTGFTGIDRVIGGLYRGKLYVVGGRPGTGKTALVTNIGLRVARLDADGMVLFFSLEMASGDIFDRILSAEAKMNVFNVDVTSPMTPEEFDRVGAAMETLSAVKRRLVIDATPALSVSQIRARAEMLAEKTPGGIRLVVADYVQLLKGDRRRPNSQREELDEVIDATRIMARDLDVPVLVAAQLNREFEREQSRAGRVPRMSDLRGTGMIEQAAHFAAVLYSKEKAASIGPRPVELRVVKHRGGISDHDIPLTFAGAISLFTDRAAT